MMLEHEMYESSFYVIKESYDLHVHTGPDLSPRLMDCIQLAEDAAAHGQAGLVLKSHHIPTGPLAVLVKRFVPQVDVVGSIALNNSVGGLNIHALKTSLDFGSRIVWMPTVSALNHHEHYRKKGHPMGLSGDPGPKISIFRDSSGSLVPELRDILGLIAERDVILATGHLSPREVVCLVDEARSSGVKRILITHPSDSLTGMSIEDQVSLARKGAYLEHTLLSMMPLWHSNTLESVIESIKKAGVESIILTTDFGQVHHPAPSEGLRMYARMLMDKGFSESQVRKMIVDNPRKLLGRMN
jgi:hypothetical protein